MNNKEEVRTQVGVYDLPRGTSDAGKKVMALFTKLKHRAKQFEATPQTEPNLAEIQQSALQSFQLQDNVIKTEEEFQVVYPRTRTRCRRASTFCDELLSYRS